MSVQVIPVPINYWLVQGSQTIGQSMIRESLLGFSTEKLLENKLVTRNFKGGLDFLESRAYKSSMKKVQRAVLAKLEKEIPYLKTSPMVGPFISLGGASDSNVRFTLLSDKSVYKYLARLNRFFLQKNIPVRFTEPTVTSLAMQQIDFRYSGSPGDYRRLYHILFYIPEIMQVLQTLHRKAVFCDANSRDHFSPTTSTIGFEPNAGHVAVDGGENSTSNSGT